MSRAAPGARCSRWRWACCCRWSLAVLATAAYAWAAGLGIGDLRRPGERLPLQKGLAIAWLTGFTACAVAASVSALLLRAGWAEYHPAPRPDEAYLQLVGYYLWVLADMLPGLELTALLAWEPPLAPVDAAAGVPVIAFRAFVLFGLLAALRTWWRRHERERRADDAPPPPSA